MQNALFILTVLGCNDAATQCETLQAEQATYASVDACYAQSEALFTQNADAQYPVVMVRCDPASDVLPSVASRPKTELADATPVIVGEPAPAPIAGVWYRIRPGERIADAVEPVAKRAETVAKGTRETVSDLMDGAVSGAANAWRWTRKAAGQLNPFD
ncbi:MAG: hypothetical protein AAGG69_02615 [Pseudomonadota bacterium]